MRRYRNGDRRYRTAGAAGCPCGSGVANGASRQQCITDGNERSCRVFAGKPARDVLGLYIVELPAPQLLRNVSERTATLNVGSGSIDLYQEVGPELLRALVELLRIC